MACPKEENGRARVLQVRTDLSMRQIPYQTANSAEHNHLVKILEGIYFLPSPHPLHAFSSLTFRLSCAGHFSLLVSGFSLVGRMVCSESTRDGPALPVVDIGFRQPRGMRDLGLRNSRYR